MFGVASDRWRVVQFEPQEITRREAGRIGGINRDWREQGEENQGKTGVFHKTPEAHGPRG